MRDRLTENAQMDEAFVATVIDVMDKSIKIINMYGKETWLEKLEIGESKGRDKKARYYIIEELPEKYGAIATVQPGKKT